MTNSLIFVRIYRCFSSAFRHGIALAIQTYKVSCFLPDSRTALQSEAMADEDSTDEPDYMSDLSIFGIAEAAPSVLNPKTSGAKKLVQQQPKPRLTVVQKQQQRAERVFEREEQLRQEGMAQAIPQGNIGFKLLEKMGYK